MSVLRAALLAAVLLVCACPAGAQNGGTAFVVPSSGVGTLYGTNGIIVSSNGSTFIIDGSGVSSPTNGITAATATNIVQSFFNAIINMDIDGLLSVSNIISTNGFTWPGATTNTVAVWGAQKQLTNVPPGTSGQVLGANGTLMPTWKNNTLSNLSDVNLTTTPVAAGDSLEWDGARWVNGHIYSISVNVTVISNVVINVGTNNEQFLALITTNSFFITYNGTPIPGERYHIVVLNTNPTVNINMTNNSFNPIVASNVVYYTIPSNSMSSFTFVNRTNWNAAGTNRWELDRIIGKEMELVAGSGITFTTNAFASAITITSTGGGSSGVQSNANQFGANVVLNIKDGANLTNLLVWANGSSSIQVSGGRIVDLGFSGEKALVSDPGQQITESTTTLDELARLGNFAKMGITNIVGAVGTRLGTNGGVLYITNTAAGTTSNLLWGTTVFVDAINGNDATAVRGDAALPYAGLSNAFRAVQSGDTMLIRPGNYTVTPYSLGFTNAPLQLVGKTNVTIAGMNNPQLRASGLGVMLLLRNCTNITLTGLEFVGKKTNGELSTLTTVIGVGGAVCDLTLDRVIIRDAVDNAINPEVWGDGFTDNWTYRNCRFINVGTTNVAEGLANDGTAALLYRNTKVIGCYFENCLRDLECYTSGATVNQSAAGVIIENNISVGTIQYWLLANHTNMTGWLIRGNQVTMYPTNQTVGVGATYLASVLQAVDWVVSGNSFTGPVQDSGFEFASGASAGPYDNITFVGNAFDGFVVHIRGGRVIGGANYARNLNITANGFMHSGYDSVAIGFGHSKIALNNFVDFSTNNADGSAIRVGLSGTYTNGTNTIISGNTFDSVFATTNTVIIESGSVATRVYGNVKMPHMGAVSDSGLGTLGLNNIVSLSTSNATSKPLTNGHLNGDLTMFGIEQGTNTVIFVNGSNIVINSTGGGGAGATALSNLTDVRITNYVAGDVLTWADSFWRNQHPFYEIIQYITVVSNVSIYVGTNIEQSVAIITTNSFGITYVGSPLAGERWNAAIMNSNPVVDVYMTNRSFDPRVGSNVVTYLIPSNSIATFTFINRTNWNSGATNRWELDRYIQEEVELAVDGSMTMSTNSIRSIITLGVNTNQTLQSLMVNSNLFIATTNQPGYSNYLSGFGLTISNSFKAPTNTAQEVGIKFVGNAFMTGTGGTNVFPVMEQRWVPIMQAGGSGAAGTWVIQMRTNENATPVTNLLFDSINGMTIGSSTTVTPAGAGGLAALGSVFAANMRVPATGQFYWQSQSIMSSHKDGAIDLSGGLGRDFLGIFLGSQIARSPTNGLIQFISSSTGNSNSTINLRSANTNVWLKLGSHDIGTHSTNWTADATSFVGYTNTTDYNQIWNVRGTSGNIVFWNRTGLAGATAAGVAIWTNTVVTTGSDIVVGVNCGIAIDTGVSVVGGGRAF
jgi:hypothetical protein